MTEDLLPKTVQEFNKLLGSILPGIEEYANQGGDICYTSAQDEVRSLMICERCNKRGIVEISTVWDHLKGQNLCEDCYQKAKWSDDKLGEK